MKKNFIQKWGKALLFLTILGIVLGALTRFFICQPLYWLTGYIFVVSGLILLVRKKYPNRIRDVDITDLELVNLSGAPLKLNDILLHEFNYVKEAAAQTMSDRTNITNTYVASIGSAALAIVQFTIVQKNVIDLAIYNGQVLAALCLIVNAVGWIFFLQIVRLRQAWCDCARAMNHIKRVFVYFSGNQPQKAEKAFLWSIATIPRANAKFTAFYFSAIIISITNAFAIVLAGILLLDVKNIGHYWFIPVALGLYHFLFQQSMFTALLEEHSHEF